MNQGIVLNDCYTCKKNYFKKKNNPTNQQMTLLLFCILERIKSNYSYQYVQIMKQD